MTQQNQSTEQTHLYTVGATAVFYSLGISFFKTQELNVPDSKQVYALEFWLSKPLTQEQQQELKSFKNVIVLDKYNLIHVKTHAQMNRESKALQTC